MKCKNCGGNCSVADKTCPYCGAANPAGLFWERQNKKAEAKYRATEAVVRKKLPLEVADKLATRILIGFGAALILSFLIMVAGALLFEGTFQMNNRLNQDKLEREMATLYDEGRFGELQKLMSDRELYGEEHYVYSQMALIYYDYRGYRQAKTELFQYSAQKEPVSEEKLTYCVRNILSYGADLLTLNIQAYPTLAKENSDAYNQYCEEVRTFCRTLLGMTEEEVAALSGSGYTVAHKGEGAQTVLPITEENHYREGERPYFFGEEPLVKAILEREAWKQ